MPSTKLSLFDDSLYFRGRRGCQRRCDSSSRLLSHIHDQLLCRKYAVKLRWDTFCFGGIGGIVAQCFQSFIGLFFRVGHGQQPGFAQLAALAGVGGHICWSHCICIPEFKVGCVFQ